MRERKSFQLEHTFIPILNSETDDLFKKLKNKSILKCILNYPTYSKSSFVQALGEQNLPYQLLVYEVFSTFYILSETQPHLWVDSNAQDV